MILMYKWLVLNLYAEEKISRPTILLESRTTKILAKVNHNIMNVNKNLLQTC